MSASKNEKRWGREQISVWLSARRKAQLREVAAQLPSGATPADALDRALDLATMPILAPRPDAGEDFNSFEETSDIARLEAKLLAAIELNHEKTALISQRMEQRLDAVSLRVQRIDSRMSAALDSEFDGHATPDFSVSGVQAIGEWLRGQQQATGVAVKKSALVRASWRAKTRVVDGILALDFHCKLAAIDGVRLSQPIAPTLARVQISDSDGPLSQVDSIGDVVFVCEALGGCGWKITFHPIGSDGKAARSIGSIKC
ncbi:hypothetical protein BVER_04547 [Candidatus Burkholderia verschuerenii]|uniref:Uncharacterized protein n=1 Tax=Candidatus Burkholderia verschuerenii TaxID=242163 RepID=A0A0L0MC54_9BURK|nr:hypothetical protein [Candidatus Burkholderia verschuerenii]KND59866.1 hypothetical protein BVER_04547 [Candidatus Burkholderia verschuerenii]